jgi:hypothetical protein
MVFKQVLIKHAVFAIAFLGVFASTSHTVLAQSSYCAGYARDFAERNTRGQVARSTGLGAIGGTLIGGAFGSFGAGALIGGGVGLLSGASRKQNNSQSLYNSAYADCMRRNAK